jgi:hypothetical protein
MDPCCPFTKWVLTKYQILVVKMNDDMNSMATPKTHMGYFYDIEVIMILNIMALLERVHVLIKFAHGQYTSG